MPLEALVIPLVMDSFVGHEFSERVIALSQRAGASRERQDMARALVLSPFAPCATPEPWCLGIRLEAHLTAQQACTLVVELEACSDFQGFLGGRAFRDLAQQVRQALEVAGWRVVDGPRGRIWVVDPVDKRALSCVRRAIDKLWRDEKRGDSQ
jgi:hypothetical protein